MELEVFYQLKYEREQLPETIRLRHREWTVLLSLDGNQSVAQTLKRFSMEEPELEQMLEKFRKENLIEDAEITYADFVSRQESARKREEQLQAAAAQVPMSPAPLASLGPLIDGRPVPQFTPLPMPAPAAVAPANSQSAPDAVVTDATPSQRKLNLKAVMDFIVRQTGGDPNAGQLAVYRVFMRVDTRLLRRNGIHSLRFQDERIVSDPELEDAIAGSVESALGMRIPESVFVGN